MSSQSPPSPAGLWQSFLASVADKLSAHVLRTWLRPILCRSFDGRTATLVVRDQFMRDWLADHYLEFIRNGLTDVARTPIEVAWVVDPTLAKPPEGLADHDAHDAHGPELDPELNDACRADGGADKRRGYRHGDEGDDDAPARLDHGSGRASFAELGSDNGGHARDYAAANADGHGATNGHARPSRRRPGGGPSSHAAAAPPANPRLKAKVRASLSAEASRKSSAKRNGTGTAGRGHGPTFIGPDQALGEPAAEGRQLNKRYVFDTFVQGPSNQFAFAACQAAAQNPGRSYNPLFIYGGVGLGKTHLLSAIGHHILAGKRDAQIIYTSSEQFSNEVINAVLSGHLGDFRDKYLHHGDALLVDDIQLIAGKERTQHEFFHIFNTLYDSQRQIVVTSDKLPHEIPDIEERLRNRFQWGLIADVQPPEIETRIAILRKKAEAEKFELHGDVAFFLARSIRSNVRELEGALVRIMAHASLSGTQVNVDFARATLSDILQNPVSELSIESIQKTVATYFSLRVSELKSSRRQKALVKARQMAMYLCRKHLGCSYPELGSRFGDKDHTTVLASCGRVTQGLSSDVNMRLQLDEIEQRMNFDS